MYQVNIDYVLYIVFLICIFRKSIIANYPIVHHIHQSSTLKHGMQCSSQLGKLGNESCYTTRIEYRITKYFDKSMFTSILHNEDIDLHIREISIHVMKQYSHSMKILPNISEDIGVALDTFLTPRPWWIPVRDRYHSHSHIQSGNISHKHQQGFKLIADIILLRQHQYHEPRIKFHSAIQFPPNDTICSQFPMRIARVVGDWETVILQVGMSMNANPFDIFEVWDTKKNQLDDHVPYASNSQCPTIRNKHRCAFLAMTNCTIPSIVSDLRDDEFNNQFPLNDFTLLDSASISGSIIKNDVWNGSKNGPNFYRKQLKEIYKSIEIGSLQFGVFYVNKDKVDPLNTWQDTQMKQFILQYSLIFRLNHAYRQLVSNRIHEVLRNVSSFHSHLQDGINTLQCTAIHIRRGDRVIPNTNMTEYCNQFIRFANRTCININQPHIPINCNNIIDLGCLHENSYGSLTLEDYLHFAWKIHQTHNIFIFSDDYDWLHQQKSIIQEKDTRWNIATLANSRYGSKEDATSRGVDYLASIFLSRKCQAFVGNWNSAVSLMTYNAMCFQHSRHVNYCPPAVNVAGK